MRLHRTGEGIRYDVSSTNAQENEAHCVVKNGEIVRMDPWSERLQQTRHQRLHISHSSLHTAERAKVVGFGTKSDGLRILDSLLVTNMGMTTWKSMPAGVPRPMR